MQDFIEINDFKILNNNNVKTFFNIKNWAVSGSIISQLETGEAKELEFSSEKSIQTKVFILSAKVSEDVFLENLDTVNFDIVDLRE